jgi:crotonobetainyl-CoA:carnitine CoA-transferase CaiB-like acyl-CoA transferase
MSSRPPAEPLPLDGITVVDASRMLPGAVLARTLVDLGARVIKVEDPAGGDALRHTPPLIGGTGAGFCALARGCESVVLDLQSEAGAATFRRLAKHADVVVESFRPGTLDAWSIGEARLRDGNPRLVVCSLSGFGGAPRWRRRAAHDLNFVALSGLTALLGGGVPGIQLADVSGALLAATAVLAALLRRQRTGLGASIDQPLAAAPLPFLTWAWADGEAGGGGVGATILAGRCPAYRTYACRDGGLVAVAAIEPKFWTALVREIGLPHLAGAGLDTGPDGEAAAEEVAARFRSEARGHWLATADRLNLPLTAVHDLDAARREPLFSEAGLLEELPLADGATAHVPGPFIPSLGRTPPRRAPRLGEHTSQVLRELGVEE